MTSSLRNRRRRATEREIALAAVALFEAKGVQSTSVAEIADYAEVSERTFFRYFARKEDAALFAHAELRRALYDAVRVLDLTEHPFVRVRRAYADVMAELESADSHVPKMLLRVGKLLVREPLIQQAGLRLDAEQAAWLAGVLAEQPGVDRLEAALFAEEIGVLFRQTMAYWTEHRHDQRPPSYSESVVAINEAWARAIARTMSGRTDGDLSI